MGEGKGGKLLGELKRVEISYEFVISIGDYNRGTHGVSTTTSGMPQLRCSHEDANMMRMIFLVSTDPTRLAFTSNYLTFIIFSRLPGHRGAK